MSALVPHYVHHGLSARSYYSFHPLYLFSAYLVIHTSGLASHPTSLGSILKPPGGGSCANGASPCGYADQCVTRDYTSAFAVYKIPLTPTLLSTASGTVNNVGFTFTNPQLTSNTGTADAANLLSLNGLTSMPTSGPVAISVSGQNMFPDFNNNGGITYPSCETDMCNAHAGQGFDYHYHGDPFGPQCLYSCANYSSLAAHPPLIGYGLDGVPIFGRHLSASAPGASVALDDCGGHNHTGMSDTYIADGTYHYHAFVSTISSMNYAPYSYNAPLYGPFMCWKGSVASSAIPNFFEAGANPTGRTDYASGQIKPCLGNANMYVASGFAINGVTGSGFNYATRVYTQGAGSVGGACASVPSSSPEQAVAAVAYVAAAVTLGGYTTATFGTGEALAFRTAVATKTGAASASSVTITAVTAVTPSGRRRTHAAAADGVVVAFTVATTASASASVSAAAALISKTDFAAVNLAVTSVTVSTAPASTSSAPADFSSSLVSTPALAPAKGSGAISAARSGWVIVVVAVLSAAAFELF
jgi:hypothetical protein